MNNFVDYENNMVVEYVFDEDGIWVLYEIFTELLGINENRINDIMEKRGFVIEKRIFEFEQENRYGEVYMIPKSFIPAINAYQIISIWKEKLNKLENTLIKLEQKYDELKSSNNTLNNKHKANLATLFNEIEIDDNCSNHIKEIARELSEDPFINKLINSKLSYNTETKDNNIFLNEMNPNEFKWKVHVYAETDEIELLTRIAYPDEEF